MCSLKSWKETEFTDLEIRFTMISLTRFFLKWGFEANVRLLISKEEKKDTRLYSGYGSDCLHIPSYFFIEEVDLSGERLRVSTFEDSPEGLRREAFRHLPDLLALIVKESREVIQAVLAADKSVYSLIDALTREDWFLNPERTFIQF